MIEGKVVNQHPRSNISGAVKCGKCLKLIPKPKSFTITSLSDKVFLCYSYVDTLYWIYESKSGRSVVYCSKYCRGQHNHRFAK